MPPGDYQETAVTIDSHVEACSGKTDGRMEKIL